MALYNVSISVKGLKYISENSGLLPLIWTLLDGELADATDPSGPILQQLGFIGIIHFDLHIDSQYSFTNIEVINQAPGRGNGRSTLVLVDSKRLHLSPFSCCSV